MIPVDEMQVFVDQVSWTKTFAGVNLFCRLKICAVFLQRFTEGVPSEKAPKIGKAWQL